jgi:hypothetical protein
LIQKTWLLGSIVAGALLVADFIDSIGQKLTSTASSTGNDKTYRSGT